MTTTVLRLITKPELQANREALCQWLSANGVDPHIVDEAWISIEKPVTGLPLIRYWAFKVDAQGRRLVDPDDDTRAWREQRVTTQTIPLPLLPIAPAGSDVAQSFTPGSTG